MAAAIVTPALTPARSSLRRYDPVLDSVVTVSRDRQLCVYNSSTEETRGVQVPCWCSVGTVFAHGGAALSARKGVSNARRVAAQVSSSWISALELYYPYPNVTIALCATYESTILLVDCRWAVPRKVHSLGLHGGSVRCLYLEAKRNYLFSSGFDKTINIWELRKNKVQLGGQLIGHRKKVNGVAYYVEGKQVISAGDDGDVFVWDPASGKPAFVVHGAHDGPIEHMHWEEDHRLLITCGQVLS